MPCPLTKMWRMRVRTRTPKMTAMKEAVTATMRSKGMNKSLEVVQSKAVVEIGWTLTCHMPTRSNRKKMRLKLVTLAVSVAITDKVKRETAMMTTKVMDPNTISPKAMGQKELCPKEVRPNVRTAKEMSLRMVSMNKVTVVRKTRGTK